MTFKWIEKGGSAQAKNKDPVLSLRKDIMYINAGGAHALKYPSGVKIGIDELESLIVLAPAERDGDSQVWHISYASHKGHRVGGANFGSARSSKMLRNLTGKSKLTGELDGGNLVFPY